MTLRISVAGGLLLIVGLGLVFANGWPQVGPQTAQEGADASEERADETPGSQTEERDDKALLLRIAREYRRWGQVDGESRLAPVDCRLESEPSQARFSQAEESTPHARKLYFLYARYRDTYLALGMRDLETGELATSLQPTTQVVVKEAWHPVEVDADEAAEQGPRYTVVLEDKIEIEEFEVAEPTEDVQPLVNNIQGFGSEVRVHPYVERDGMTYRADELAGLFIMAKISDEALEDTDNGWIYGTVSTEGEVTSVGRVESCMECHQEAENDRLFGL